jgi:hypothetical protein
MESEWMQFIARSKRAQKKTVIWFVWFVLFVWLNETTQVFRLKAEGYALSCNARIKPFKTISVSTTLGSSRDESFISRLKTKSLQPIYLSNYSLRVMPVRVSQPSGAKNDQRGDTNAEQHTCCRRWTCISRPIWRHCC